MARYNRGAAAKPTARGPVASEATPGGRTALGAPGYVRDAKSELFLLAVSNFVGHDTYHERGGDRDARFVDLARRVAVEEGDWFARFVRWLRSDANVRTASLAAALEGVRARLDAHIIKTAAEDPANDVTNRRIVDSVLRRADEPGEALAYWVSHFGRSVPKPVKRGIADAAVRMYTERGVLKYDGEKAAFRFGDVVDLTHPAARTPGQDALFRYALDRRHGRTDLGRVLESLPTVVANAALRARVAEAAEHDAVAAVWELFDPDALRAAGMTWEDALSLAGGKVSKRRLWEALVPTMGYMALLRNLRNMDDAGVSDDVAGRVAARLASAEEVAASRQFPFRFLSAYREVKSLRWAYPLEIALQHSLANVPELGGHTLVLVDRSPSMWEQKFSPRSSMPWADAAAVFGVAVALRAERADLVEFSAASSLVAFDPVESLLKIVERFGRGDGTDIPSAVRRHLRPEHTRVVVVTDEQTQEGWLPSNTHGYRSHYPDAMPPTKIDDLVPRHVPLYMWNFGGYRHGATPSGVPGTNRHTLGGLTDAAFRIIPLLEAGRSADWPF